MAYKSIADEPAHQRHLIDHNGVHSIEVIWHASYGGLVCLTVGGIRDGTRTGVTVNCFLDAGEISHLRDVLSNLLPRLLAREGEPTDAS